MTTVAKKVFDRDVVESYRAFVCTVILHYYLIIFGPQSRTPFFGMNVHTQGEGAVLFGGANVAIL